MRNNLSDLITGADLAAEARARARDKEYAFAASSDPDELAALVRGLEARGYAPDPTPREGQRRKRLSRPVAADIRLENGVWTMLHRLGFTHLNKDRQFYFANEGSDTLRQVDIVAKDEDTLILVECTQRGEEGKKSLVHLIDKVVNLKRDVDRNVARYLPDATGLKIKFLIATDNVLWSETDRRRAREDDIGILTESDRRYFAKLHGLVGGNSKYQFLSRYFARRQIPSLEIRVPATKHTIGGRTYYHFCCSPHDLLKISTISHKARTSENDPNPYQRMVTTNRLKAIGNFIRKGGVFPTNIVANYRGDDLYFEEREGGASAFGLLHLPSRFAALYVIDGQHRLYGYAYAKGAFNHDRSMVSVLLYEGLAPHEEVVEFLNINTKQVKIRTDLAMEILGDTPLVGDGPKETVDNIAIHVVKLLEETSGSPFRGELKSLMAAEDDDAKLTRTNLIDGIKKGRLVGSTTTRKRRSKFVPGPLSSGSELEPEETKKKAYAVLAGYFSRIAKVASEHWKLTEGEGAFLHTNNGVRTLLVVLQRLIEFHENRGDRFERMTEGRILDLLGPYADEIGRMFRNMKTEVAGTMRRRTGLGGIDDNADEIELHLYETTGYASERIRDLHANRDAEGTKNAEGILGSIRNDLKAIVLDRIQGRFSEPGSSWWFEGIPDKVRKECDHQVDRSSGRLSRVEVMTLANLREIVRSPGNWMPVRRALSLEGASGNIDERLGWLDFVLGIEKKISQMGTILVHSDVERLRSLSRELTETVQGEGLHLVEPADDGRSSRTHAVHLIGDGNQSNGIRPQ